MFVTYGLFGLFANIALAVHVILIFALMSLLGSTLTLPGIAGIVLTIGTAVDSNVLIYERIREEAQARPLDDLLARGGLPAGLRHHHRFQRHHVHRRRRSCSSSAPGPVKGFAVTLILGIITTVVTAVTMTRMMIALWYRWAKPTAAAVLRQSVP